MIKKTTLLVLVCAVVLGGLVYYFDWKKGNEVKPAVAASKPAFSIQTSDITSITLTHPGEAGTPTIRLEKSGDTWNIIEPIQTEADQPTVDGIADQLAAARVSGTEPGTPDRLKVYGLDPPQVSLEFQLRNGTKHTILIGDKDFAGDAAYTVVDGAQKVSLLPEFLATSVGKSVEDLRDRAVVHVDPAEVSSIDLVNASGRLAASKKGDQWHLTKPSPSLADPDAMDHFLEALETAKMTSIVEEKPEHLDRYGLQKPAITFTATAGKGSPATLLVGKKTGNAYFARDASRPTIFTIDSDLYSKLAQKYADLRNRKVVQVMASDIQQIQLTDAAGSLAVSRKKDEPEEWTFEAPVQQKGKPASGWKIVDALTGLTADQVIDHPSAAELKPLVSPEMTVVLTDEKGEKTTARFSKPSGDFVYAQASNSTSLYKLKKEAIAGLNLKLADLTP
jgi:hypothetical protein